MSAGVITLIAPIVVADVDLDGCALQVSLVQHQAQLPQDLELTFNTGLVVTTITLSEDDLATFLTAIADAAGRMNLRRPGRGLHLVTE